MSPETVQIIQLSLSAVAAIAAPVAVALHLKKDAKAADAVAEAGKVANDLAQALPAGPAAAIGVVMRDLEEELAKVLPDSKAVQILERLKLVVEAAGAAAGGAK